MQNFFEKVYKFKRTLVNKTEKKKLKRSLKSFQIRINISEVYIYMYKWRQNYMGRTGIILTSRIASEG